MGDKRLLLGLGGAYHDFEGFAASVRPLLESAGYSVHATHDLKALEGLQGSFDIVGLYTCLGGQNHGEELATQLNENQIVALGKWVRSGGALFAIHGATVTGQTSSEMRALIGGTFITHPPQCSFMVYPLRNGHPLTQGVGPLTIFDELYTHDYDLSIQIHLVAVHGGFAFPIAWSKRQGLGRVSYLALGHGPEAWQHPGFQNLVLKHVGWLTAPDPSSGR